MREPKRQIPKQYAPVKFGEPFNPDSVEGVQIARRQAAAIRRRKEEEAELAEIDARQAAEEARLAARSPLGKIWDRVSVDRRCSAHFDQRVFETAQLNGREWMLMMRQEVLLSRVTSLSHCELDRVTNDARAIHITVKQKCSA